MSIIKAIKTAYVKAVERGWDKVYWAIDLHGVCLESNYESGGYKWINEDVLHALHLIQEQKSSVMIIWSSVHPKEETAILNFFESQGINFAAINENPFEQSTKVSCFDKKFYFSILLDDKAGFDPETDWKSIIQYFKEKQ